jgi:glutamate formiminotransferase
MNLTDFEQTSLQQAYDAVRREAGRLGCAIADSEIVGLVPRKALDTKAEYFRSLGQFSEDKVLENRLAAVTGKSDAASAA